MEEYFDIENYKSLYFEPLMYKLTEFNSSSSKDTKRLIDRMLLFDVVTHVGIEYKHYFINILLDKLYDFIKPLLKT